MILQEFNKHLKHRIVVENNKEWIQFRRPEDGLRYMLVWLFYKFDFASLKVIGETDLDGIRCTSLKIKYSTANLQDKIKKILQEVPFGLIKVRTLNENAVYLDWYSSTKLPLNPNIPKVKDKISLDLKSVLLTEDGYQINLNDEWLTNVKEIHNRIKLIHVKPKSILLKIPTPHGLIKRELKQGEILELDYYCT